MSDHDVRDDDCRRCRLALPIARHVSTSTNPVVREPATEESYTDDVHTTFDGRALAVVRPTGAGTITVTATAPGCDQASFTGEAR